VARIDYSDFFSLSSTLILLIDDPDPPRTFPKMQSWRQTGTFSSIGIKFSLPISSSVSLLRFFNFVSLLTGKIGQVLLEGMSQRRRRQDGYRELSNRIFKYWIKLNRDPL